MDPVILKMVASLMNGNIDLQGGSSTGGTDFSGFSKYLSAAQKESPQAVETFLPLDSSFNNPNYDLYMTSFKKALLAKGKPLSQCTLKSEDLPLLKKLLAQFGFTQEKIDLIFKDLLQDNSAKEINFSKFFQKMAELNATKSKNKTNNCLDATAVPHLELILRNFGMTPGDLDHAFSAAKLNDGRLDLEKLAAKLKGIINRQNNKTSLNALQKLDDSLADKLKMLGIDIPGQDQSGQISLKDFISSLEKAAGRPDVGHKLSAEIKTTMDQVLAKTVVSEEKSQTADTKARGAESFGKEGLLSPLLDKVQPDSEGVLLAPFREQNMHAAQKGVWTSLKNKKSLAAKNGRLSSIKRTEKAGENVKQPVVGSDTNSLRVSSEPHNLAANGTDKINMLAETDGSRNLKDEIKQDIHTFKSETKIVPISQTMRGSMLSEAAHSIEQNQKPAQDFLPAYLVNQVGKQISKALIRADRVIRLQLKPPELGTVKIEMDIKDKVLKLEMVAENSSVKELLLSNLHELRNNLIDQGIKVEELQVQVGHDFNQSLANSQEHLKERQRYIQRSDSVRPIVENLMDEPSGVRINMSGNHLLNLVA